VARILIVDDEPDIRFMMRLILESAGHKVTDARHGAAGLESVKSAPPDLVITDVMMPTMDGLEFIERLRSNPETGPRRSPSWSSAATPNRPRRPMPV